MSHKNQNVPQGVFFVLSAQTGSVHRSGAKVLFSAGRKQNGGFPPRPRGEPSPRPRGGRGFAPPTGHKLTPISPTAKHHSLQGYIISEGNIICRRQTSLPPTAARRAASFSQEPSLPPSDGLFVPRSLSSKQKTVRQHGPAYCFLYLHSCFSRCFCPEPARITEPLR